MKIKFLGLVILLVVGFSLFSGRADIARADTEAGSSEVSDALRSRIDQAINQSGKAFNIREIRPARLEGLYTVHIEDGPTLFTDSEAQFFIVGDLVEIKGANSINHSKNERDTAQAAKRRPVLEAVDPDTLISYKPSGENKGFVYVFTDVNCPYCRRFHQELVPAMNDIGIEVRYFAYPIIGKDRSRKEMTSAWCAEDRNAALDDLKSGKKIPTKTCDDAPIQAHLNAGMKLSINSTPSVLLPDGRQVDLQSLIPSLQEYLGNKQGS